MVSEREEGQLQEQQGYYEALAQEFDAWLERDGAYDVAERMAKDDEVALIHRAIADFRPAGAVLELACGTGRWTKQLAQYATRLVAVDGSAAMLRINAERAGDTRVERVVADVFDFETGERFDVVFFAFWLSHVPESLFDAFWSRVGGWLKPGGRVFFADDSDQYDDPTQMETRRLKDGRQFTIVKELHSPEELESRLKGLGWNVHVSRTGPTHYYGLGRNGASAV